MRDNSNEKILKEFDKFWANKFGEPIDRDNTAANSNFYWYASPNEVKDFLLSALTQQKASWEEKIEGMIKEWFIEVITIQEINRGRDEEEARAFAGGAWKVASLRLKSDLLKILEEDE